MRTVPICQNERGATLALVALTLFLFLGLSALAIDLGMVKAAGAQAQRAADAAALAGASAFIDFDNDDPRAVDSAIARAHDYARSHAIRKNPIVAGEDSVIVIPDSLKVRVIITRPNVPTWFANTFGISEVTVSKRAAAVAADAGLGKCVKPFAVPDIWNETNNACGNKAQDCNKNNVWDINEGWDYNPSEGDTYSRFDPDGEGTQTGYGSDFRDGSGFEGDRGRPITIKAQSPGEAITSGFFYPWRMGDNKGAKDYKESIMGCNEADVELGVPYSVENGNMKGPTTQAVNDLVGQDPDAFWDPSADGGLGAVGGVDPKYGDWRNSPRVIPLGLFSPEQIADIQSGGNLDITFNNIALFFLEGVVTVGSGPTKAEAVQGRFLYFASGGGNPGEGTGSLVKVLRLVE